MALYKCCLCDQLANDDEIEVRHYGLKSACKTCVDELLKTWPDPIDPMDD